MQKKEIEAIRDECKRLMNASGGHDWLHVLRVYNLAKKIGEAEGADMAVLEPAALMHDLGRGREEPGEEHAAASKRTAKQLLEKTSYPAQHREAILEAISEHSWRSKAGSLEAKILQDADRLDALGAVGVMRCFVYGGAGGREDYNVEDAFCTKREPDDSRYSLDHFYSKLLKLEMHTETAEKIAEKRRHYLKEFLERLENELTG